MTKSKWSRIVSVLCIVFIGLLAGCGEDDKGADSKTDTGVSQEDAGPRVQAEYKSEYQLRFTSFAFDSTSPGKGLNGILDENFDQDEDFPIIVLIDMDELDIEQKSVKVRGGSGIKTETSGTYKWDPETDLAALAPGKIQADGALNIELPTLDFVATFPDQQGNPLKTIIPIKSLTLTGHLDAKKDGSEPTINDGLLKGFVTLEDGNTTFVQVPIGAEIKRVPLTGLFDEEKLNYDSSGKNGAPDAWLLTATFTAIETNIVD